MRVVLIILMPACILAGCRKNALLSLHESNTGKRVVIQPIGEIDSSLLVLLANELNAFFGTVVHIENSLQQPLYNSGDAHALLDLIEDVHQTNSSVVLGITQALIHIPAMNESIQYTPEETKSKVFGLAVMKGRSAIVSVDGLQCADKTRFINRVRNVMLHELGHTMGLDHCFDENCLMSESYGKLSMLDLPGREYCNSCEALAD